MTREKGIVKWFSTDKGYGFIRREDGAEIFVHHTDIEVDGYASLKNGETVEFDVFESDRGPKARNLVPLEADGSGPAARARTGDGSKKAEAPAPRKRGRVRRSRPQWPIGVRPGCGSGWRQEDARRATARAPGTPVSRSRQLTRVVPDARHRPCPLRLWCFPHYL